MSPPTTTRHVQAAPQPPRAHDRGAVVGRDHRGHRGADLGAAAEQGPRVVAGTGRDRARRSPPCRPRRRCPPTPPRRRPTPRRPTPRRNRRPDARPERSWMPDDLRKRFEADPWLPARPLPAAGPRRARRRSSHVLVAAPTGSGKTVVAEYAVDRALAAGAKAFYTTPLKALSNQKYGDLVPRARDEPGRPPHRRQLHQRRRPDRRHDHRSAPQHDLRRVTGARRAALVVLDEVHYLQDRYRGPVWEEVIVHLDADGRPGVPVGHGVERRGGRRRGSRPCAAPPTAVIEEHRPVDARAPLPGGGAGPRHAPPAARRSARRTASCDPTPTPPGSTRARGPARGHARPAAHVAAHTAAASRRSSGSTPRRCSRRSCSSSAAPAATRRSQQCLAAGLRLTDPAERAQIRAIAEEKTNSLPDADLEVLRYDSWLAGLEAGFAAHHAGMVPPMKEAVEEAFAAGLAEGRVRDRDARARHQHAGTVGGHREGVEVHRRTPRVPHPGRVHAAHGPGRPAGHRRARLRDRLLEPVRAVRAGGVARVPPHRRAALLLPPDLQHGGEPRPPLLAVRGASPPQPVVRAVPRRPRRRRARTAARPQPSDARAPARGRRERRGDVDEYRRLKGELDAAAQEPRRHAPAGRGRSTRCAPATSSWPGATAGGSWC